MLDLADVVRIADEFSPGEQARACAAADRDPRVKAALDTVGYGLTQTLAAAPQLVARWEDAKTAHPYGRAVLAAALDAARLGARAPLSAKFLRAAAPGYLTSTQQADAPENWFKQAMAYATRKLHGAVAALRPEGTGMGQILGYTNADYLLQHATRERHRHPVPASTWDAASHLHDPADTARLAHSAATRQLLCYAIPLYQHADATGDPYAAGELAALLRDRGDLDGARQILHTLAGTGYPPVAGELARLLPGRGDLDGAEQTLRTLADTGDPYAAIAELARLRYGLDRLRARAATGDPRAVWRLAGELRRRGDLNGLRTLADTGNPDAIAELARLLCWRDQDEAEQVLRASIIGAGVPGAARELARLLADQGRDEEAQRLRRFGLTADGSTASA